MPSSGRRVALTLALVASCHSLSAQETEWLATLAEKVEVNVINLEVFVANERGRPVSGLTAGQFELFENGEPVEIQNFYEVAAAQALSRQPTASSLAELGPALLRPLHLLLYVDDTSISASNRGRVLLRLKEFLQRAWRPDVRVLLLSNERSLVLRHGVSGSRMTALMALDELAGESPMHAGFERDRRALVKAIEDVNVDVGSGLFGTKDLLDPERTQEDITRRVSSHARSLMPQILGYSQQRYEHVRDSLRVLEQLVDAASGLPGRKTLVHVSDGLPLRPGEEIFEAYARRFSILADVGANLSVQTEAQRFDLTPDFLHLVDRANAAGVSLYTLDASPVRSVSRGAAQSGTDFWSSGLSAIEADNQQAPLLLMARQTGGRAATAPAAYDALLEGILGDYDNYYSLGYAADRVASGERRSLEVRVKGQSLQVRHRKSFRTRGADEEAAARTLSALLMSPFEGEALTEPVFANPLGVDLAIADQTPRNDESVEVRLRIDVPLANLVLMPGGEEHLGRLAVFVAVRDSRGRTSTVSKHLCPLRIPNSEVLTALGRKASCGVRLAMRRGRQKIAVSVHDEVAVVSSTLELMLDVGAVRGASGS